MWICNCKKAWTSMGKVILINVTAIVVDNISTY